MKISNKNFKIEATNNPSLSASRSKVNNSKAFDHFIDMELHKVVTLKKKRAHRFDRFSEPVIVPSDYKSQPLRNQTKDWYILFRYRPEPGERMKVIKKSIDLNYYTGGAKIRRAEHIRKVFHKALKQGFNPLEDRIADEQDPENVFSYLGNLAVRNAFASVFTDECPKWSYDTVKSYLSSANRFMAFLHEKKWEKKTIKEFNKSMAKSYSDWLIGSGYDITTHNNHLRYAGTFFGYLVERDVIEVNPFSRIKKKRDAAGGKMPFSPDQLSELRKSLDRPALLFLDFAIDSLLRSGELERLKIEDIRFESNEVAVLNNASTGRITKDRQNRYVLIKPEIMKRMKSLCEDHSKESFVFGSGFLPTEKKQKRDHLSRSFTELIRDAGFEKGYSLYSCRHTGTIIKWKIDKWGAEELMNQLGHNDFGTTQKYLKDVLGVYRR